MVTALVSQTNERAERAERAGRLASLTRLPLKVVLVGGSSCRLKGIFQTAAETVPWHRLERNVKHFIKSMVRFLIRRSRAGLVDRR